jgi:hypothetical protein
MRDKTEHGWGTQDGSAGGPPETRSTRGSILDPPVLWTACKGINVRSDDQRLFGLDLGLLIVSYHECFVPLEMI